MTLLFSCLHESGRGRLGAKALRAIRAIVWSALNCTRLFQPAKLSRQSNDDVKMAIVHTLELGIDQTQSRRKEVLDFWECRAEELQHDEIFLHRNMHPEIANVYKGKRFLLLRGMLSSVNWPDVKLFDDLV